jgi:hypothetical protein
MNNPRQITVTFQLSPELVTALTRMADRAGLPLDYCVEHALISYVFRNAGNGHVDIAAALDAELRRRCFAIVPPA